MGKVYTIQRRDSLMPRRVGYATVGVLLGAPAGIGTVITALFMGPLICFFRRAVSEPLLHRDTGGAPV